MINFRRQTIVALIILLCGVNWLTAQSDTSIRLEQAISSENEVVTWYWRLNDLKQPYPYLKVLPEKIELLSSAGKVVRRYDYLPGSSVVHSADHHFLGYLTHLKRQADGQKLLEYRIIDNQGREIYPIRLDLTYDEPIPALYLTNSGRAILADAARSSLTLIDAQGSIEKIIHLFEDNIYNYEKFLGCAIS
ncbi:MAG: hypothetical protein SCK70_17250, partial [bacterium]|nr:hypothetical protein [bacterium]